MIQKYSVRKNSLNELRLWLAVSVVFIHLSYLTQTNLTKFLLDFFYLLSVRAVDVFFVLSGFLIYMSWDKKPHAKDYIYKRFFRIYPLYFFVVSIVFVFYLCFVDDTNYVSALKYLFYNLILLNFFAPVLPGLFDTGHSSIINGALWSIKVEVLFYILVPFLYRYVESRRYKFVTLSVIFILSLMFNVLIFIIDSNLEISLAPLYNQLPSKLYLFVIGIVIFKYFSFFDSFLNFKGLLFGLIVLLISFSFELQWLQSAFLVAIVFFVALSKNEFCFVSKVGDLSYSIYITHFPLIQLLIWFEWDFKSLSNILCYFSIQLALSFLIWRYFEQKFIRFSIFKIKGGAKGG
jgi:peptidoglycan/LPS O-acetylase OafA/YrhL